MKHFEEELSTILSTGQTGDPFGATRWTLVGNAQDGSTKALNELVDIYRGPIVKHLCRHLGENDGEDAAQDYLLGLLESGYLGQASESRGKFRAFLLHDIRYFVLSWRRYRSAQKRGGKLEKLSYERAIEEGMQLEDGSIAWQDEEFDRDWTLGLMGLVRQELEKVYESRGNSDRFRVLEQFIDFGGDADGYANAGDELGLEAKTVKVAVSRLRQEFAQILRHLVGQSLVEGESIDDELEYLKQCFLRAKRKEET